MDLFTQNTENQEVTEINSSNTSGMTTENQVVTELSNKEKKELLKIPNAKFTIKGMLDYNGDLKVFNVNAYYREYNNSYSYSINIDKHVQGMNIDLFGSKFISLYTFDMLNNRTKGKIRYSNITIIK
tara:strand:- start:492 stop:872 length:381 start_codon:yes stop_codon:yes gene_type:complete